MTAAAKAHAREDRLIKDDLLAMCIRQRVRLDEVHRLIGLLSEEDKLPPALVSPALFEDLRSQIVACRDGARAIQALEADCPQTSRLQLDVLTASAQLVTGPAEVSCRAPDPMPEPPPKASWAWPWKTRSLVAMSKGLRSATST